MWDFPRQTKEELVLLPAQLALIHLQFQQALLGQTTILSYVVTILDNIVRFFDFVALNRNMKKKASYSNLLSFIYETQHTLFKNENEWQKIEQVWLLLPWALV